jgi:hypothetical protein
LASHDRMVAHMLSELCGRDAYGSGRGLRDVVGKMQRSVEARIDANHVRRGELQLGSCIRAKSWVCMRLLHAAECDSYPCGSPDRGACIRTTRGIKLEYCFGDQS